MMQVTNTPLSQVEQSSEGKGIDERPTPTPTARIEYKRLVQRVDGDFTTAADAELNRWLNQPAEDGWGVWDIWQIGDAHPALTRALPDGRVEVTMWQMTVLFRMASDEEAPPQPVKAAVAVEQSLGEPVLTQTFQMTPGKPIAIVFTPVAPDDTQIIIPVTEPALTEATRVNPRERLRAEDFALLTAPDKSPLKQ